MEGSVQLRESVFSKLLLWHTREESMSSSMCLYVISPSHMGLCSFRSSHSSSAAAAAGMCSPDARRHLDCRRQDRYHCGRGPSCRVGLSWGSRHLHQWSSPRAPRTGSSGHHKRQACLIGSARSPCDLLLMRMRQKGSAIGKLSLWLLGGSGAA